MAGLTLEELRAFFDGQAKTFKIEAAGEGRARLRLIVEEKHLRYGGTVSGPALMTLADAAIYIAVLAELGPVYEAVTSNLNINFLRRPPADDVLAFAKLLKVGKRLAVGEVELISEKNNQLLAHVVCTYALPSLTSS